MDNKESIMKEFSNTDSLGGEQASFDSGNVSSPKRKKRFNIWLLLLIICVLLIIGVFVYYFVFALKPKAVLANGMGKMMDSLNVVTNPLSVDYQIPDSFSVVNNTKIAYNGEDASIKDVFDNTQLNFTYMYDDVNKKMLLDVDSNLAGSELNVDYYVNNLENYVFLQDVFDKYIKLDDLPVDIFLFAKIKKDDLTYIYDKLVTSLDKNINDDWISRQITFDGSPTVVATLKLTKERYEQLIGSLKNDLLNDSKIADILNTLDDELVDTLKAQPVEADFTEITLKVKQSIIKDNLKSIELVQSATADNYKYIFEKDNDKITIKTYYNDELESENILNLNGKNFDMTLGNNSETPMSVKGSSNGDYYTYSLVVPYSDAETGDSNIELSYRFKNTVSNNLAYDNSIGISFSGVSFVINNVGTVSALSQEINVDTSGSVPYSSVNQEELNTKLTEKILPFIMQLYGVTGTDISGDV